MWHNILINGSNNYIISGNYIGTGVTENASVG